MEVTTLQILNVIGTWIAAIGTVGAVITSLWLSYNSNRVKLKIKADARILVDSTRQDRPMMCFIEIVNIGNKPVKINSLGWKIKRRKEKKEYFQVTRGSIADTLPLTLTEGSDATITIDFTGQSQWLTKMAENIKDYKVEDLRIMAVTNIESFEAKIEDSLVKELKKEIERLSKLEDSA